MLFLLVYVYDILITEMIPKSIQQVIIDLNTCFALKTLVSLQYFLGFEVIRTASGLHLSQHKYVMDLPAKTKMLEAKVCITPAVANVKFSKLDGVPFFFSDPSLYRSTIRALQYLNLTRPTLLLL
ncbi:hypothetical protein ACOSQ3_005206 [Xanthoceras sorbifolium]